LMLARTNQLQGNMTAEELVALMRDVLHRHDLREQASGDSKLVRNPRGAGAVAPLAKNAFVQQFQTPLVQL
jgi:hypothetical protein